MNLLLDTHLFIWAIAKSRRLSPVARDLIDDPRNALYFSASSLWEIAIKRKLGRPDFNADPRRLRRAALDSFYTELPIIGVHAMETELLPLIHKDPFDRLLVAQATAEGMLLLTADAILAQYKGPVRLV